MLSIKNKQFFYIFLFFLIGLLIISAYLLFLQRKNALMLNVNSNFQTDNEYLSRQFPKEIDKDLNGIGIRCTHFETIYKEYSILDNMTAKASIGCYYFDSEAKVQKIYFPLVLEFIENNVVNHQFLGGIKGNGLFENSTFTDAAIINMVSNELELENTGSNMNLFIPDIYVLTDESKIFQLLKKIYSNRSITKDKIEKFSETGNPIQIQVGKINGSIVILPLSALLEKEIE